MRGNISNSEEQNERSGIDTIAHDNRFEVPSEGQLASLSKILQLMVCELLHLHYGASCGSLHKRESHIRHLVIYLLNIGFGISMRRLSKVFKVSRSTIAYACQTIENRRDDKRYDRFLTTAERIASLVGTGHRPDLT